MTMQTSINTTNFRSTDQYQKSFGAITYDEGTLQKAGTLVVGYGATQLSFSTVSDYMIFVNQVIIPLTDKINYGSTGSAPFAGVVPGVAGPEPITD